MSVLVIAMVMLPFITQSSGGFHCTDLHCVHYSKINHVCLLEWVICVVLKVKRQRALLKLFSLNALLTAIVVVVIYYHSLYLVGWLNVNFSPMTTVLCHSAVASLIFIPVHSLMSFVQSPAYWTHQSSDQWLYYNFLIFKQQIAESCISYCVCVLSNFCLVFI